MAHIVAGLMKYAGRAEWASHLDQVRAEHLGAAMDLFDLDHDGLASAIGEHWMLTLWGCAFEDLCSRAVGPDRTNMVDEFLRHRGWTEKLPNKIYMRALRDSVMSIYEISDVVPGASALARDLLRGGNPVRVSEKSATHTLRQWDKVAARVMPLGDKTVFAGGLLRLSAEAFGAATNAIEDVIGTGQSIDDSALRQAAPLFSSAWLVDTLSKTIGDMKRKVQNSDGEDVLFHTLRFPIARNATQADIAARLDELGCLRRESETFWNWLGEKAPDKALTAMAPNAVAWNITLDDDSIVLGNVEAKGRFLHLMVNSASRAAKGKAMLEHALGELIREPKTEIETVEQMQNSRPRQAKPDAIPLETATPLIHGLLDKQYRALLDEPTAMCGDISPRQAIRTEKGRELAANWLKHVENMAVGQKSPSDPMATYDFGWMWRDLGIESLRK